MGRREVPQRRRVRDSRREWRRADACSCARRSSNGCSTNTGSSPTFVREDPIVERAGSSPRRVACPQATAPPHQSTVELGAEAHVCLHVLTAPRTAQLRSHDVQELAHSMVPPDRTDRAVDGSFEHADGSRRWPSTARSWATRTTPLPSLANSAARTATTDGLPESPGPSSCNGVCPAATNFLPQPHQKRPIVQANRGVLADCADYLPHRSDPITDEERRRY
jgi:hypothetical protein